MPSIYSKPFPLSGLTYGHLINGLKEEQNITPLSPTFKSHVTNWIKEHVFHNQPLSLEEEKSLEEFSVYFRNKAKMKSRSTRSQLKPGFSAAVDDWLQIQISIVPTVCNCAKCIAERTKVVQAAFETAPPVVLDRLSQFSPPILPTTSTAPSPSATSTVSAEPVLSDVPTTTSSTPSQNVEMEDVGPDLEADLSAKEKQQAAMKIVKESINLRQNFSPEAILHAARQIIYERGGTNAKRAMNEIIESPELAGLTKEVFSMACLQFACKYLYKISDIFQKCHKLNSSVSKKSWKFIT